MNLPFSIPQRFGAKNKIWRAFLATTFLVAPSLPSPAEVKLPAVFGDRMVLQEGAKIPIWGTAAPGETVAVTAAGESATATADAAGKWRADLAPLSATGTPITMTIAGKTNTVTFSDILVGEVWICSGQSNMAFNLGGGKYGFGGAHNANTILPQASDPQLRFFRVAGKTSLDPQDDVMRAPMYGAGDWEACTSESAGRFSAVAYFFGRDLRRHLNKPIGLILSAFNGTQAQAWMSLSGLKKEPALQHYVDEQEKIQADFPQASAAYSAKLTSYQSDLADWKQNSQAPYEAWVEAAKQAKASGQPVPPAVSYVAPPVAPASPDGGPTTPASLFNGMIAPLVPYAIKGVIWYQGESNTSRAEEYRTLFPCLITDWREQWGEGNFPFLFVQLAGFRGNPGENWPLLREAQLKTLSLPETGMATAIDIGNPNNIHPLDKEDIGNRLALVARHVAYQEDLVYSGPIYDAMKTEGNAVTVTFTQVGSGLVIGKAPWVPAGGQSLPLEKLVGFTVAGADQKWNPAEAKIVGDTVIVSSPSVPNPVAVRYDWANAPMGNLYNKDGLPASSFRTDDWADPPESKPAP